MKTIFNFILSFFFIFTTNSMADDSPVYVEGHQINSPAENIYQSINHTRSHSDAGDFLRDIPGVTGSRFGGHGIEPVTKRFEPRPS